MSTRAPGSGSGFARKKLSSRVSSFGSEAYRTAAKRTDSVSPEPLVERDSKRWEEADQKTSSIVLARLNQSHFPVWRLYDRYQFRTNI
jgi:hypothetical protein